jgi:hypothetical protein
MMRSGGLGERGFLCVGGKLIDESLLDLSVLLFGEGVDDGSFHFIERLDVRVLLLFGLDDVIAEAGADEIGNLARLLAKGGLVEFSDGGAVLDPAQFAALILAAGIVGIFLREVGEVLAVVLTKLVEDVLRFGFGGGVSAGAAVGIDGDEDVADFDLRIDAVELLILAVVLLDLRFGDLRFAAGEVGIGDVDVLDFAGLRIGVHVARGVLGVESLKLGAGGVDGLAEIVGAEDGVIELDLRAFFSPGIADLGIGDDDAAGDEIAEAVGDDLVLDFAFEFVGGDVEVLRDELGVLRVADVFAAGEEVLAPHAGVEEAADVVVGSVDAEAVGLFEHDVLLDDDLAGLLHEHGHERVGNLLAAHHTAGGLLHVDDGDGLRSGEEAAEDTAVADGGIGVRGGGLVVEDAGHEEDDHGDAGAADDEDEEVFGEVCFLLKEANHGMVTAFSVAALSLARGRAERRISWVLELFIIAGSRERGADGR